MRTVRVSAADGCEWEVRAFRVRFPPWRQIDLGGDSFGNDYDLISIALAVLALPFTLLLIPLAIALLEFPLALGRAAFSDTAWVEAVSHFLNEMRFLWRTTRADAPGVRAYIAATLPASSDLKRAQLVETTGPPG